MLLFFISVARCTVEPHNFTQTVDHFSKNPRYFTQRYFVNKIFSNKPRSIILYLGGANEFDSNDIASGPILEIANQTKSVIVGLEHRYFGRSVPTENMSTFNMQYCSVPQAILDIKNFVLHGSIRDDYCVEPAFCKLFLMGKGYAGGLATWASTGFKQYYSGAWASSAPLVSENNYTKFDENEANFFKNLPIKCDDTMKKVYDAIQSIAIAQNDSTRYMMQNFSIPNAESFISNTADFLYMFSESISRGIRDSSNMENIKNMCSELHDVPSCNTTGIIKIISNFSKIFTNNSFYDLRPQLGLDYGPMRAYFHLKCHDLGGFPTSNGNLRSPLLNSSYFNDICIRSFNRTLPDPDIFNRLHGGNNPRSENVIFTNGVYDPYISLSCVKNDTRINRTAYIIDKAGYAEDFSPNYNANDDGRYEVTRLAIEQAVKYINSGKHINKDYITIVVGTGSAVILLFAILLIVLCLKKSDGKPDLSTQPLMSQNLN